MNAISGNFDHRCTSTFFSEKSNPFRSFRRPCLTPQGIAFNIRFEGILFPMKTRTLGKLVKFQRFFLTHSNDPPTQPYTRLMSRTLTSSWTDWACSRRPRWCFRWDKWTVWITRTWFLLGRLEKVPNSGGGTKKIFFCGGRGVVESVQ